MSRLEYLLDLSLIQLPINAEDYLPLPVEDQHIIAVIRKIPTLNEDFVHVLDVVCIRKVLLFAFQFHLDRKVGQPCGVYVDDGNRTEFLFIKILGLDRFTSSIVEICLVRISIK